MDTVNVLPTPLGSPVLRTGLVNVTVVTPEGTLATVTFRVMVPELAVLTTATAEFTKGEFAHVLAGSPQVMPTVAEPLVMSLK